MCINRFGSSQAHGRSAGRAFTLVELLVVIGIIALLIAILMPALTHARQQAARTACAAKLHSIMQAAQMHTLDHQGYYPLAGVLPGIEPQYIDDTYCAKYDYFSLQNTASTIINHQTVFPRQLAPVTDSLATEMHYTSQMYSPSNTAEVQMMYDPTNFIRNFICPGQANDFGELTVLSPPGASFLYYTPNANESQAPYYSEPQSYVWNEAILGWNPGANPGQGITGLNLGRLQGHANQIRQPALTMFAADGLHGANGSEIQGCGAFTLCNWTTAPVTMADALSGSSGAGPSAAQKAADPTCFDKKRHGGMINVAFCDGHVECRNINSNDLKKIFLLAP